jgi:polysaccharide export outer membrane protein
MKHLIIVCLISFLFTIDSYSQVRQLPANIDTNTVDPAEIPSAEKLKILGASDEEIKQIIDFKERKLAERNANLDKGEQKNTDSKKGTFQQGEVQKGADLIATSPPSIIPDTEKIFGHSFFKNNNIKFFDKANQLKAPDNYLLGVGDELSISIWGFSDYNEVFKIDENGAINPRLVGRIYLNNLSFKDAKGLIASRFKSAYDLNNSQIDVTLSYSRIISVNIVGEVNAPGSYTVPSVNTAFNVLAAAGGIKSFGSVRKIYVKRNGQTIKTLDIYEYLMNPDSKQDFFLENNDYILIPYSGAVVKILGQVKRPMGYELIEKDNLKSLIEYAGGFESDAYKKRIQIKRFLNSNETIIDIDYDSLITSKKEFELKSGDEVLVRKIQNGYNNFVELVGAVKLPGSYELKAGDKITDIIKRAEGVTYDVFDSRAFLIRLNPDLSKKYIPFSLKDILDNPNSLTNVPLQNQDVIKIFSKSYFKDEFLFSVIGAVRTPGDYVYGDGITLKDALYLAGGLKKEAAKNRIEISRAVDFVASSGNIVPDRTIIKTIQPYDQILIRTEPNFELQKNIVLTGEVMYPGVYPILRKDERISSVIQRAGGLSSFAFAEGATIKRAEFDEGFLFFKLQEVMKDSNSLYNYIVKSGDIISIPKVEELIQLTGEISYPNITTLTQINAPFEKRKSARYYVKHYGLGFSDDADKKNVYVIESGGYVHRTKHFLFFRISPKVTKGASVVVPKKIVKQKDKDKKESEPINWNKAIENATVKITGFATLWLLITKLK